MAAEDFESLRLVELAKRLTGLTHASKIKWAHGSADGSFLFSTGSSAVTITNMDNDGRHPYLLEVFDDKGQVVDSLKSGFSEDAWGGEDPRAWNDLLERLWVSARRSATNVDAVISKLLSELPSEEPPF